MASLAGIGKQIASCESKAVYHKRRTALIAAYGAEKTIFERERRMVNLAPYRCQICNEYHLTSHDPVTRDV